MEEESSEIMRKSSSVFFILIGCFGVFINSVAIFAVIFCKNKVKSGISAFILSTCVSDLIFSAVIMPTIAARHWLNTWRINDDITFEIIISVLAFEHVVVCLLNMVAVTINRPKQYQKIFTFRNIIITAIGIWTVAILLITLTIVTKIWEIIFNLEDMDSQLGITTSIIFIFSIAIISKTYFCIKKRVKKGKKLFIQDMNLENTRGIYENIETSRIVNLMLTIFIFYLIFYLPLMPLVIFTTDKMSLIHITLGIIYSGHIIINPFIFLCTNQLYREAYRQILLHPIPRKNTISDYSGTSFISRIRTISSRDNDPVV